MISRSRYAGLSSREGADGQSATSDTHFLRWREGVQAQQQQLQRAVTSVMTGSSSSSSSQSNDQSGGGSSGRDFLNTATWSGPPNLTSAVGHNPHYARALHKKLQAQWVETLITLRSDATTLGEIAAASTPLPSARNSVRLHYVHVAGMSGPF